MITKTTTGAGGDDVAGLLYTLALCQAALPPAMRDQHGQRLLALKNMVMWVAKMRQAGARIEAARRRPLAWQQWRNN